MKADGLFRKETAHFILQERIDDLSLSLLIESFS
nr:MAG TPA: hypothetical protein [Bacteriophage sp.]